MLINSLLSTIGNHRNGYAGAFGHGSRHLCPYRTDSLAWRLLSAFVPEWRTRRVAGGSLAMTGRHVCVATYCSVGDVTGQGCGKLLQSCLFTGVEAPLQERPGAADCIYATGYNPASGARSREWGGGSIHALPRMPCSARASALAVMTSKPSVASATSRKALSLWGSRTRTAPQAL